jgi:hypothetical protein
MSIIGDAVAGADFTRSEPLVAQTERRTATLVAEGARA